MWSSSLWLGQCVCCNAYTCNMYTYNIYFLFINACVRIADVMIFTFVSLMPVHNVFRICKIIKE